MTQLRRAACCLLLLLVPLGLSRAQDSFYLKDGDRVVFYGDSITEQGMYTSFVEAYAVTRFPRLRLRFTQSGWGGDRVTGGGGGPIDLRLNRDVLIYKPTVMTIMLGMNDGGYRAFDQPIFETYSNGYKHILDVVQKALPGIRLTLIRPSPYDDATRAPNFEGGYNAVLVRYGDFLQSIAADRGATVADLNAPVVAALKRAVAIDPQLAQKIVPDRVHPGPGGHLLMAEAILKAWNAPATVAAVEIDAAGKRVVSAQNARIDGLQVGETITWNETDGALPMPLDLADPVLGLALKSSDFVEALDQEPLRVIGLPAVSYTLKIDGTEVGTFARDDLAAGVNLALRPTPMVARAAAVRTLLDRHNALHRMRWRQLQLGPLQGDANPGVRRAFGRLLAALDAEELGLEMDARTAAQPAPHRFELDPQPAAR